MKKKLLFLIPLLALSLAGCKDNNPKPKPVPEDTYTVTWIDYTGDVLEVDEGVKKGEMPSYDGATPTRERTAQYSYEFKAWSPSLSPVDKDVTYMATYSATINTYDVTWKNWDGEIIRVDQDLEYGAWPYFNDELPTREPTVTTEYGFDHWEPELSEVVADVTYTAVFASRTRHYQITWNNWNGNLLKTTTAEYGSVPTYPGKDPSRPSDNYHAYVFAGWSPALDTVTGPATYTAQYTETTRLFTIKFVNYNNEVIATQNLAYGATVSVPADPTYPSDSYNDYYFNGWDKEITTVTGDATYKATYIVTPLVFTLHSDHYSGKLKNKDYEGEINIPAEWNDLPVSEIDDDGFTNAEEITKVVIPSSISVIPDDEFANCVNLRDLTLCEGVTTIGDSAFLGCYNLHEIVFPESITEVKGEAFRDCRRLYTVTFHTHATASMFGTNCFEGCYSIASLWFKNGSAFSVGNAGSYSCHTSSTSTRSVSFDIVTPFEDDAARVVYMYDSTWNETTAVSYDPETGSTLYIEGQVDIKQYAFRDCYEINYVYLSDEITMLGMYSFYSEDHELTIYYEGTIDQLSHLNRGSTWMNREITTIICSDGEYEGDY